jgi:hypothetical protein
MNGGAPYSEMGSVIAMTTIAGRPDGTGRLAGAQRRLNNAKRN